MLVRRDRTGLRHLLAGVVVLGLLVAACSGDDDAEDAADSPTSIGDGPEDDGSTDTSGPSDPTSSTTMPTFTGDPDSAFCELVTEGRERPVQDPFAAEIEPKEVELRLRNLRNRIGEFLDVSPPELSSDLTALTDALDEVDAALEPYDYDLGAFGADGGTLDVLDSPALESVGFRLDEYGRQVCAARSAR